MKRNYTSHLQRSINRIRKSKKEMVDEVEKNKAIQ